MKKLVAEEEAPSEKYGPVRRIGIQTRSMTGTMPCGNRYESSLERDLMELLRMDSDFLEYHAQPVKIRFVNEQTGRETTYVPDGLIFWRSSRRPWLVEVKPREECVGQFRPFLRKFRAARAYARSRDWHFCVLTEAAIRGQRLQNLKFLHRFRSYPKQEVVQREIEAIVNRESVTVGELLRLLEARSLAREIAVGEIWRMVAHGQLAVDLDKPINNAVPLSIAR